MKILIIVALCIQSGFVFAKDLIIGGETHVLDVCTTQAEVIAKSFIYLREDPALNGKIAGRLSGGTSVYVCAQKNGWLGVVIRENEEINCGVSTPWPRKKKYKGPCKSGWIEVRQAKIVID